MWLSVTLAAFRDEVRRRLAITPPIDRLLDFPLAIAGQEPAYARNPTNQLLDSLIRGSMAEINRRAKSTEAEGPVSSPVLAQTVNGPYTMDLDDVTGGFGTGGFAQISSVEMIWYVATGSTVSHPLTWSSSRNENTVHRNWMDTPPGTPTTCYQLGQTLQIWPAPASAGTFYFTAKCGPFAPNSDGDLVAQLPSDYFPCLLDCVVADLLSIQPNDEVYAARLPTALAQKERSIGDVVDWMNTRNGNYVPGLIFKPTTQRRGRTR